MQAIQPSDILLSGHRNNYDRTVNKLFPGYIYISLSRPLGYVTHTTDRILWAFRTPELTTPQVDVARAWLGAIDQATQELELQHPGKRNLKEVLTLQADMQIEWTTDGKWDDATKMRKLLPAEV